MIIITRFSQLRKALMEIITSSESVLAEALRSYAKRQDLIVEIESLKIEKSKIIEEQEKRNREIDHKIGLERKRQEFEIEAAKRETTVKIREENLAANKKRFEDEMKFQGERFKTEVSYLKEMIGQILERLPDARIMGNIKINKE